MRQLYLFGYQFFLLFFTIFSSVKNRVQKGKKEGSKITKLVKIRINFELILSAYFSLYKIIFINLLTHIREKSSI